NPALHLEEFVNIIRDGAQRASVHRPEVTEEQRVEGDELGLHFGEDTFFDALTNDLLEHVRNGRKRRHDDFAPLWRKYIEFPVEKFDVRAILVHNAAIGT